VTEDELVAGIRERLRGVPDERVLIGIGDDAAVWQPSRSNRSVITTDALVEGVHFTRAQMSAHDAGWRALAANLSDVAAMGARPVLATVALGFPPNTDPAWLLEAYEGIAELAKRARCAVAGGDLTRAPTIIFSITVVGEVRASNLKMRSGAYPGDVVASTGALGASAAGLAILTERPDLGGDPRARDAVAAFRTPEPRLREGHWLAASRHVRAMMDLSDGLSTDLTRLCRLSGVGALLDKPPPIAAEASDVASLLGNPRATEHWALHGGEDFELLVAIEKRSFAHLAWRYRAHFGRDLVRLGSFTSEPGVRFSDRPIEPHGWDHLA
jgi:thiamine-monophosphate kinase